MSTTNETTNTSKGTVKIWTGKLRLNGERKSEGDEVQARIILTGASVVFEICEEHVEHLGEQKWRAANASEVHSPSWIRALGETGSEVA